MRIVRYTIGGESRPEYRVPAAYLLHAVVVEVLIGLLGDIRVKGLQERVVVQLFEALSRTLILVQVVQVQRPQSSADDKYPVVPGRAHLSDLGLAAHHPQDHARGHRVQDDH